MTKIAIFIPNLKVGGAERVIVTLANYFVKNNNVDIVLLKKEGELLKELDPKIKVVDLNIVKIKKQLFGLIPLIKYLRENKPSSLLCVMWPLTFIGIIAKMLSLTKTKVIVSDHTTFSKAPWMKNKIKRFFFSLTVKIFYPFANERLNVSDKASRDLELLGRLKENTVKTIYNPINVYKGEVIERKDIKIKKIISVGSLKWAKNHEFLLKSFKGILDINPNVHLLIVGDGGTKNNINNCIKDLGISDNVFLLGNKNKYELEDIYLHSDLLVLTSHYEGFSMVLLEAMNYGVPVVSVDCDNGPREILDNGKYGVLVPNYNDKELAKAILSELNKNHDSNKLRERAKYFSIDIIGEKYLEILK